MTKTAQTPDTETQLRRTLTLRWLVFYGLGVTVGAGIFALIGEIVGLAGKPEGHPDLPPELEQP